MPLLVCEGGEPTAKTCRVGGGGTGDGAKGREGVKREGEREGSRENVGGRQQA